MSKLEEVLTPSRLYVRDHAQELGYSVQEKFHEEITHTCRKKVEMLQKSDPQGNWVNERAVKALYGVIEFDIYGFVMPELGQIIKPTDVNNVFARLGLDYVNDFKFRVNNLYTPKNMAPGTCTPFVSKEEMANLTAIFIHDMPELDNQTVDISIGGKGNQAKKTSLHLPYKAIHDILFKEFGNKIHKVSFF